MLFDPPVLGEVIDALGLRPGGGSASERVGVVDGVAVRLRRLTSQRSDLDLVIEARPAHGLDLGLWVRQAGPSLAGAANVETGDAAFDGVCQVTTAPGGAHAARALLDAETRSALTRMLVAGRPEITDDVVALNLSAHFLTADALMAKVRECVRIARSVDALGERLSPPSGIGAARAAAFADACRELGLGYRAHPLSAGGDTPDSALWVRWRSHPVERSFALAGDGEVETPGYRVAARFHRPLGVGLRVEPAGLSDRLKDLVGLGDLRLGDAAFDAAWRVRATSEDGARAMLGDVARAKLQRLRALGVHLKLDDSGLDGLGALPADPGCVPEVLRLVTDLRGALRPWTSQGAYR